MNFEGVLAATDLINADSETGNGWLEIRNGTIARTGRGQTPPGAVLIEGTIVPGFVDTHAHGAVGVDFGRTDDAGARAAAAHHASRGTTSLIASVASASPSDLERAVGVLRPLFEDGTLAGIHLEGPYLATIRRGAHNPGHLRDPDLDELNRLIELGEGAVRSVTLAPELPGAEAAIRFLGRHGVVAAIGHTDSTAAIAHDALNWGATVATHLFNGMPELRHRAPGPVGVALVDPRMTLELILDGVHLAPEIVAMVVRVAPGRYALVSDAMEATGQPDGDYEIAGSQVRVTDGVATLADGSSLAGSTQVIADCISHLLAIDGVSLRDAVEATSTTPRRALGLPTAGLTPGTPADLVVLQGRPPMVTVSQVMRGGKWLSSSS